MRALREEIVPELAWQMGRPVKFGVRDLRGFEERARAMIALAETALAPVVAAEKRGFKRYIRREPRGVVLTIAPWNYPYLTSLHPIMPTLMPAHAETLMHDAQTTLFAARFKPPPTNA